MPNEYSQSVSKDLIERATNWRDYSDATPIWVGKIWKDWEVEAVLPQKESEAVSAAMVKYIRNLPRKEDVEATIAFRPEAEPLLRHWKEAWDRSFPNWEQDEKWSKRKNEEHYAEYALNGIKRLVASLDIEEEKLSSVASAFRTGEDWLDWAKDDLRDKRLHVIDDADICAACVHLAPGMGLLAFGDIYFQYDGVDADGYPRFSEVSASKKRVDSRVNDNPKYWTWDFFLPYLNRRSVFAANVREAGALIADMAWQGHKKAFIKAGGSKAGTWTISLEGIKSLSDGEMALRGVIDAQHITSKTGFIVQEHLPFTHEQRFFVFDGRVIASVCSDRHFSVLDKRPNRRLDDRIATLDVPEVDHGEYDRGITHHVSDRKLSATFAWKAREIARVCKANGVKDFVVDLGITSRGVTAVEINTLHLSGPYCLDRKWFMQAFDGRRRRNEAAVEKKMLEHAKTIIGDKRFVALMEKQLQAIKVSEANGFLQSMLKTVDAGGPRRDNLGMIETFAERIAIRTLLSEDTIVEDQAA